MQINKRVYLILAIFLLVLPGIMAIGNISILDTYYEYYGWVDFALYLMIFIGITQEFMNLKFKKGAFGSGELGQGAKVLSLGLGLALAISLVTWEVKAGFYLFQLGPWIVAILLFLAILWLVGWLRSKDKTGLGLGELRKFLLYIVIIGIILYLFFPGLIYDYLPWSWVSNLFNILMIVVFVLLLISLGKRGESTPSSGGRGIPGRLWDGAKKIPGAIKGKYNKSDEEYKQLQKVYDNERNARAIQATKNKKRTDEEENERKKFLAKGILREEELKNIN